MISAEDAKYLTIYIDMRTCVREGNAERAKEIVSEVNAMELPEDRLAGLEDCVSPDGDIGKGEAVLKIFITGLNCVTNKEDRLKELEAACILERRNAEEMNACLDESVKPGMFEGMYNCFTYARNLLSLCQMAKRWNTMEEIRKELASVTQG